MDEQTLRKNPGRVLPGVIFIVLLMLTGCVYLRLFELKNQLAQFDRYFKVDRSETFTLHFLQPVLYGTDLVSLSKLPPTHMEKNRAGEVWTYVFKKMESETQLSGKSDTDILYTMQIDENQKLSAMTFGSMLLRIAPPEFLELSLRSLGGAKVDRGKRQVRGDLSNLPKLDKPLPRRTSILDKLGKPFSQETLEGILLLTYHYQLQMSNPTPEQEKQRLSVTRLYFDPQTDELVRVYGKFAGMKISIDYRKLIKNQENLKEE